MLIEEYRVGENLVKKDGEDQQKPLASSFVAKGFFCEKGGMGVIYIALDVS